jgi:hypothetical protein
VRAELLQLEKAGYNPNDWVNYPDSLQSAQARVAAQNSAMPAGQAGYGSSINGKSEAGHQAEVTVSTYSPPVYVVR